MREWNERLFRPIDPLPLAMFRIAFGIVLFFHFLALCMDFHSLFTEDGPVSLQAAKGFEKILNRGPVPFFSWNLFEVSSSTVWAEFLFVVYGASILAILVGWRTRIATLFVFALAVSMHRREPFIWSGGDLVLQCFAFWLIFIPASAALSLDACHRRRQAKSPLVVRNWAVLLLQAQLAVIYFATFLMKLEVPAWRDGTALGLAWTLPVYSRSWSGSLADIPWLVQAGTWGSLTFEIAFPLLIWSPRFRNVLLAAGVFLHVAIELTLRVAVFSWVMLACYIPFVPAASLRRWIERIDRRAASKPNGLLWQIRKLQAGSWAVYFDGRCSFCKRWAGRGQTLAFPFVEWRDFNLHREEVAHLGPRFDCAAYLIIGDRLALPGFAGFRRLLLAMPALWVLLPIVYFPGARCIGDRLYRTISIRYGPVRPDSPPV